MKDNFVMIGKKIFKIFNIFKKPKNDSIFLIYKIGN